MTKGCITLEGETVGVKIGDSEKFNSVIYRAYGVLVVDPPISIEKVTEGLPDESDGEINLTQGEYEEFLDCMIKWNEIASSNKNREKIICQAKSKELADIVSFPTPVKIFTDTPYGAEMIINAQIDSILHRKSLKNKSSEALLCLSWDGKKDICWGTKSGKPPKAAMATIRPNQIVEKQNKKKK